MNELYEELEPDKINEKGKKTIDLLVISHLDRDHVNEGICWKFLM